MNETNIVYGCGCVHEIAQNDKSKMYEPTGKNTYCSEHGKR